MLEAVLAFGPMVVIVLFFILSSIYGWGYRRGLKDIPERENQIRIEKESIASQLLELENQKHTFEEDSKKALNEQKKKQYELDSRQKNLTKTEMKLQEREQFLTRAKSEAVTAIPWLAKAYSDLDFQKTLYTAHCLDCNNHAYRAAEKVRETGLARREALYLAQNYKLQLDYFLSLFPWLEDYLQLTSDEVAAMSAASAKESSVPADGYQAVKEWLSPAEYENLSNIEKWQLALDRYNKRQKTNWQIGIEYERYIGYLCEQHGCKVQYFGATQGLEDMGRDLIAKDGQSVFVIQCKRWAKEKTIHEKHIFQLYGSCILLRLQNPSQHIIGVFVTTTNLSPLALQCAQYLQITVYENIPLGAYPQIKCNISKTGDRIYHLPFDQQYDRTLINPSDGDCYAFTVAEAEKKGFRRAFRWHGSS